MKNKTVTLGDRAKDKISGYTGIVVAITQWLNGCRRITIAPENVKDPKAVDDCTFDEHQIEVIKPGVLSPAVREAAPLQERTGGPRIEPARTRDPK